MIGQTNTATATAAQVLTVASLTADAAKGWVGDLHAAGCFTVLAVTPEPSGRVVVSYTLKGSR
jgi:hypothetical protein